MKNKNWLSDVLEEFSYQYYLENYPKMVDGIKELLLAGEKPAKIKKYVESIAGKSLTTNTVTHLIDYISSNTADNIKPNQQ